MTAPRITAREAHDRAASGKALLVCAYEDPDRCAALRLPGGITLQEFRARRSALPRDQEIVFYCS